jgi:hypothetical protein
MIALSGSLKLSTRIWDKIAKENSGEPIRDFKLESVR